MTTTTESKSITVVLSDAAPVTISTASWTLAARADWHSGAIECQASEVAYMRVREHRDGRRIVYGVRERGNGGMPAGYRGKAAGYLVAAVSRPDTMRQPDDEGPLVSTDPDEQGTVRAIRRVAGVIDMPELADECIGDLPARELV